MSSAIFVTCCIAVQTLNLKPFLKCTVLKGQSISDFKKQVILKEARKQGVNLPVTIDRYIAYFLSDALINLPLTSEG